MSGKISQLIHKLHEQSSLTVEEYEAVIDGCDEGDFALLLGLAAARRDEFYGRRVFLRGLIEISSYCKNDCLYCGIRRSNTAADRYRLSDKQILDCCRAGYKLGYRTFVLQGGEDPHFSDSRVCGIVSAIKSKFPDCAVTLSLGEKSRESYRRLREAGADRYLLRHETANACHYSQLHPPELSLENRLRCLADLYDLGYQVGTGFMVGSPFQTARNLAEDMVLLERIRPHMVGIGPFIPGAGTPFADFAAGTVRQTVLMTGLIRLALPQTLIPATTALATADPRGRELAIAAGANVCMPNLSPTEVRSKYSLYDHKAHTGGESAENLRLLAESFARVGCKLDMGRGESLLEARTHSLRECIED